MRETVKCIRPAPEVLQTHLKKLLATPYYPLPVHKGRLSFSRAPFVEPVRGAVYAIWWNGPPQSLMSVAHNTLLPFQGPNGHRFFLDFYEMFNESVRGYCPLYVGKTSGRLATRLGQHMMMGSTRAVERDKILQFGKRRRTSNQLRDRLDRLLSTVTDTRALVAERIRFSFVDLPGPEHIAIRFFLEDLAIGHLSPPFNLDSER